jgi:hypothetical protein
MPWFDLPHFSGQEMPDPKLAPDVYPAAAAT